MKLLISTYACAPNHGSEQAVGWNWTTEAHRLGHQVWALASPVNRAAIEAACRADPELAGIHWTFPDIGIWPLQPGVEPVWERTYNLLWQRKALRLARALHRTVGFDAVHHLTWGGVRAPTFLGALGAPLIVGPIGGGETSPGLLRDGFTFKAKVIERIRDPTGPWRACRCVGDLRQDTRHAPAADPLDAAEVYDIPGSQPPTSTNRCAAPGTSGSAKAALCRSASVLERRAHRASGIRATCPSDA